MYNSQRKSSPVSEMLLNPVVQGDKQIKIRPDVKWNKGRSDHWKRSHLAKLPICGGEKKNKVCSTIETIKKLKLLQM